MLTKNIFFFFQKSLFNWMYPSDRMADYIIADLRREELDIFDSLCGFRFKG